MDDLSRAIPCQVHRNCYQGRDDEDPEAHLLDLVASPEHPIKQKQESEDRPKDRDVIKQQVDVGGTHGFILTQINPFAFEGQFVAAWVPKLRINIAKDGP
jgi:hypothetical protein